MDANSPEHVKVRAPFLEKLKAAGWKDGQVQWKPEWRVPKTPHDASKREAGQSFDGYPVDVAIFDDVDHTGEYGHVLIIGETKQPTINAGVEQLKTYMLHEPNARLGIWTNGNSQALVYRTADGGFYIDRAPQRIPGPNDSITIGSASKLTFDDLEIPSGKILKSKFERILDVVVARDTITTRGDERLNQVCNAVLAKLWSDELGESRRDASLMFQVWDTEENTARKIREIFHSQQLAHRDLFSDNNDKEIRLSDHTLSEIAFELSKLRLKDIPMQVFSEAFQVFRTASLKSEEGQYYTPYSVIKSGVRAMDITPSDIVIDPACGTGGFVLECYRQLMEYQGVSQDSARQWARRHLYAVDRDRINVKLTKALMLIIGDGSTHTYLGDSLREHLWRDTYPELANNLRPGSFTAIITNPPFGKNLKLASKDNRASKYSIALKPADKKSTSTLFSQSEYEDRELGLLFLERCHRLLVDGGRLGIILPETYMFSPSYAWLQSWIESRFILRGMLNIPMEAFQGFCRAKTNFYIFEKIAQEDLGVG